jgi:hypothetical protein
VYQNHIITDFVFRCFHLAQSLYNLSECATDSGRLILKPRYIRFGALVLLENVPVFRLCCFVCHKIPRRR